MSNLTGIDILLFDVVVQSIGFNPCPDATFVAVTPPIQSLDIFVAVSHRSKRPVASVVYVLRMLRVCEPNDNRQDLIAAFRRSWPCDVQSVGVARVDGFGDLPPRPFVFALDLSRDPLELACEELVFDRGGFAAQLPLGRVRATTFRDRMPALQ